MIQSVCLYHQEVTTTGSLLRWAGPKPNCFSQDVTHHRVIRTRLHLWVCSYYTVRFLRVAVVGAWSCAGKGRLFYKYPSWSRSSAGPASSFGSCADQTFPLYTKLGGVALAVYVSLRSLSKEGISLSVVLLIAGLAWLTLSCSIL